MDPFARFQERLGDRYRFERALGGGGMSRVFLAEERALGRRVVIKTLPSELAAALDLERFRREIQLAARLQHPHIVPLLAAGEEDGLPYFTMPFVEGETLRARLARGAPLPAAECVHLLRDMALALACAHDRGVVHRDLKPENVLLSGGAAMVTDFGVAKALSAATGTSAGLTSAGLALGTPAYMAPEQAAADPAVDARADLYALGCIAYEMACGTPPFAGRPPQQLIAAHLAETPIPIAERNSTLPAPLAALITRLLQKRPDDRPASAAAVVRELEGTTATRLAAAPASARSSARRVARWLALGAALVLVAIGALMVARRVRVASVTAAPVARSIAVIPFADLSPAHDNEYFSDGITEELIDALGKVDDLRVAARSSAFAFKGRDVDARDIGRRLDVGTVLEGSVRKEGKRVRIHASLVDARNGYEIWSDTYDRELADVFAVQEELARAIAGHLRLRLATRGDTALVDPTTSNLEAYTLYLQGRYFWNTRTEPGLARAIEYFQRAIALDPRYARAYAGLADAYNVQAGIAYVAPDSAFPRARTAARRALELDSALVEAHTALAFERLFYERDRSGADVEFRRALALDPRYPTLRLYRAWYFLFVGEPDSSLREIEIAQSLDPLSMIINVRRATILYLARRYDSALVAARHAIELDSLSDLAHGQLGQLQVMRRDAAAALAEYARANALAGGFYFGDRGYALAAAGERAWARAFIDTLEQRARTHYVDHYDLAVAWAGLGDVTRGIAELERAAAAHSAGMLWMDAEPMMDPLRRDPRFAQVAAQLRLR